MMSIWKTALVTMHTFWLLYLPQLTGILFMPQETQ
jgi:hypothetical protein